MSAADSERGPRCFQPTPTTEWNLGTPDACDEGAALRLAMRSLAKFPRNLRPPQWTAATGSVHRIHCRRRLPSMLRGYGRHLQRPRSLALSAC